MATSKRERVLACRRTCAGSDASVHAHRFAYTLLELMVVLAILTAVMLVAWPRITGRLQLVAPREAALQLKSDLAEARERAIRTGEPWVVRIETGSGKYEIGPVQAFRDRDELALAGGGFPNMENARLVAPPSLDAAEEAPQPKADRNWDRGDFREPDRLESDSTILQDELPAGMVFEDGFAHPAYDANLLRDQMPQAVVTQPPQIPSTGSQNGGQHQLPRQIPHRQPDIELSQSPLVQQPQDALVQNRNWKFAVIYQPDGRASDSEIRLKEELTNNKMQLRIRGFTGATTIGNVQRWRPEQSVQVDPTQQLDPLREIQEQQQILQQQQRVQQGGQPALPPGAIQ